LWRCKTPYMTSNSANREADIVGLVDAFARRICPAVVDQHKQNSVCSALGIWLLLAACAPVSSGEDRERIEEALGCTASRAADLLGRFYRAPPTAVCTAVALWIRSTDRTTSMVEWSASLPAEIQRGPIPSQVQGDAWVNRMTEGLINRMPIELSPMTRLVLVSALATKVSWVNAFAVESAHAHLRRSSPWQVQVAKVLVDYQPSRLTMLAETEAAGLVAVHFAEAAEDLGVLSVIASPSASRQRVFEAAHELAQRCRNDTLPAARRSLFDLPVGVIPGSSPKRRYRHTGRAGTKRILSTRSFRHGGARVDWI
jgi:serine protease inhibitor